MERRSQVWAAWGGEAGCRRFAQAGSEGLGTTRTATDVGVEQPEGITQSADGLEDKKRMSSKIPLSQQQAASPGSQKRRAVGMKAGAV